MELLLLSPSAQGGTLYPRQSSSRWLLLCEHSWRGQGVFPWMSSVSDLECKFSFTEDGEDFPVDVFLSNGWDRGHNPELMHLLHYLSSTCTSCLLLFFVRLKNQQRTFPRLGSYEPEIAVRSWSTNHTLLWDWVVFMTCRRYGMGTRKWQ